MRKHPESRGRVAVALLAAVVATACGSTQTEVESGVVAAGLMPALKLSQPLPTQAGLAPGAPADSASAHGLVQSAHSAVAEAEALSATLPDRLSAAVREAAVELARATQALSVGDWSAAAHGALEAADELRRVSPRSVALSLVDAASAAMPPEPGVGAEEPVSVSRARRLAWWARVAIGAESYELAIQRAYYASVLLGVDLAGLSTGCRGCPTRAP